MDTNEAPPHWPMDADGSSKLQAHDPRQRFAIFAHDIISWTSIHDPPTHSSYGHQSTTHHPDPLTWHQKSTSCKASRPACAAPWEQRKPSVHTCVT
eukprot:355489-Chlamydomonas_euryale.AAC.4